MILEFKTFPKIPRLSRDVVVTEKIDGSNAQIAIYHRYEITNLADGIRMDDDWVIFAGSRSRWLQRGKTTDNYGFAEWVGENFQELIKLGPGHHFGEWWGAGIQRNYGLKGKIFSLFNTGRWGFTDASEEHPPACCGVVPLLYEGPFSESAINVVLESLEFHGSRAAPGFMDPEGVVIYHTAAKQHFKKLLKNDLLPKGGVA